MGKRSSKKFPFPRNQVSNSSNGEYPSLLVLERFSEADFRTWNAASRALTSYNYRLFSALEAQRRELSDAIRDALSSASNVSLPISGWTRIVDFLYSQNPLSAAGYRFSVGGRFNIGERLAPNFKGFPTLYIAESFETAMKERFGITAPEAGKLQPTDFGLMKSSSISSVVVNGVANNLFDLRDHSTLKAISEILAEFKLPADLRKAAREMGFPGTNLVRTPKSLHKTLMHPDWRRLPNGFGLPANSQIFGKMLRDAGFDGVVFQSVRGSSSCMALFIENFSRSQSFVELAPPIPDFVQVTRLDASTWGRLI